MKPCRTSTQKRNATLNRKKTAMKKTTFKFSKTKVVEINRALTSDGDAGAWFDVCNGYARIRVDNTLLGENRLTVESQQVKMPPTRSQLFSDSFYLEASVFDNLAENGKGLTATAVWFPYKPNQLRYKETSK